MSTYTQEEIDKLVDDANQKKCEHMKRTYSDYGPDHRLVHCKDCRRMYVESKEDLG